MTRIVVALALAGLACPAPAPHVAPPPVVVAPPVVPDAARPPPDAPAVVDDTPPKLRLPKTFVPTKYEATLKIDPGQPAFDGSITITGEIKERTQIIWLHGVGLDVKTAVSATATFEVTPRREDLLELRAGVPLEPGPLELVITYKGKVDRISTDGVFEETFAGSRYVYTQHESIYARRTFPCIDEPDTKVPWQLTLDIPEWATAVSNTPIVSETPAELGHKRAQFAPTKPIPSYLVAFGVGPFDYVDAGKTKSGTPVRIVTMKGRSGDAAYAAKITPRILELLEDWFGIPYPYDKLDILTIPVTAGFGAMENAGLVTVTSLRALLDPKHASWSERAILASLLAHELAHQWFGDLVTMAWWDDIWLNEGFATWIEPKITAKLEPAWHGELRREDQRERALEADGLVSARRIRQPIEKTDDIFNVFDGITYEKAASVLAMFEHHVGDDVFQRGVRAYLAAHAYGNATAADFEAAISQAAGQDVGPAFSSFLDQAGEPELVARVACTDGPPRVELAQSRYVPPGLTAPPPGSPWLVPVCIAYERAGKRAEACTLLAQATGTIALATKSCPRWVLPNVEARGYYRTALTADQAVALRDEAWPLLAPAERRALFFELADEARAVRVPLQLALSFIPKLLAGGDRFAVAAAVELPESLDRFVPDELRAKFEAVMRATFSPGATKLGIAARPSDDLDAEQARTTIFHAAAWSGRDPELVKQAIDLAAKWRELPAALRGDVLAVAIDADAALFDRVLADVKTEPDSRRRRDMFRALAAVRDPARLTHTLGLLIDPAVDIRESFEMLADTSPAASGVVARFVRDHEAELLRRLPTEYAPYLALLVTRTCDPKQRDEAAEYSRQHYASLPGGAHEVALAIEDMDECIARRAAIDPDLRAWLGGYRIPRPKEKPKK
ncbi:MAG TPA: M1 family metallopeptidase [Kofleriaceae bacterium]|nr:M1 family metallopeptidase [Kofleriaceae bacterium]